MQKCCCGPRKLTVTSVVTTATTVTLTVSPLLDTTGDDSRVRLCVFKAQIPAANTGQIIITDGTTTLDAFMCNGNFLRADSLRTYICRNGRGECCVVFLDCCRGDDPDHITVFNRMCPSNFEDTDTGSGT